MSGRAGRLGRRAQIVAARVLGYLSAVLAVVGVVTLAKGSPGVGGLLLLAAFVLVAIAYAFVRSVNRRSVDRRSPDRPGPDRPSSRRGSRLRRPGR
ncbi:hypothetical protein IFT77_11205 [Frigoribacterium sp. CFBP 13729]|uniref:hypothetical protein n=1 Tax=unclassified Frigoribacterium TaxID=2627005 RepID=UPI0017872523|nr:MULTISPECIES: hypothetical protein [unclassified Frigoribacterium]MBD8583166.1 hypothetical protein [Frigoribacterium sp. CFBP 8766]MBD8611055.1 hypothetical protein [Frigoribacterium sp. CFBP 13729]